MRLSRGSTPAILPVPMEKPTRAMLAQIVSKREYFFTWERREV